MLAGLLLNLTPGNDTVFILSKSIAQGRQAGVVSALGIGTGSIIHTALSAFGLSLIITQSILIFNIVKLIGAAYLVYIGIRMWIDRSSPLQLDGANSRKTKLSRVYRDAVLTNVLNPKVAMFYIAFLPQFIDPMYSTTAVPFMILGLTFTFTGTLWCITLAWFAASVFSSLRQNAKFALYLNKVCGSVLIGLGLRLAFVEKR